MFRYSERARPHTERTASYYGENQGKTRREYICLVIFVMAYSVVLLTMTITYRALKVNRVLCFVIYLDNIVLQ